MSKFSIGQKVKILNIDQIIPNMLKMYKDLNDEPNTKHFYQVVGQGGRWGQEGSESFAQDVIYLAPRPGVVLDPVKLKPGGLERRVISGQKYISSKLPTYPAPPPGVLVFENWLSGGERFLLPASKAQWYYRAEVRRGTAEREEIARTAAGGGSIFIRDDPEWLVISSSEDEKGQKIGADPGSVDIKHYWIHESGLRDAGDELQALKSEEGIEEEAMTLEEEPAPAPAAEEEKEDSSGGGRKKRKSRKKKRKSRKKKRKSKKKKKKSTKRRRR